MSETTISEHEDTEIEKLLLGRRIVLAEQGAFADAQKYEDYGDPASGRLTLDDGTEIYVFPNVGGCSCSAGDYELEKLASVDNVITAVRVADETPDADGYGWTSEDAHAYRIYVVADAVEVNVLSIEGDDGNGYYGSGYELMIRRPSGAS